MRAPASIAAFVLTASTALVAPGCGDSSDSTPADVAGNYTIAVTNRDNGCDFANFTPGDSSQNIPFNLVQNGSAVTGTIGGVAGVYVGVILGSNQFEGSVSGNSVTMTLYGTTSATTGNCTYTINATVTGTLTGDALQGRIDYTKQGNGNPDCAAIEGCVTRQDFSGSRPPQ